MPNSNVVFTSQIQESLLEAQRLRSAAAASEADFLKYLMDWESDETRWKGDKGLGTGFSTFSELLEQFNLAKYARLDVFKSAVATLNGGFATVREIGLDAAYLALRIPATAPSRQDPNLMAQDEVVKEMLQFVDDNNTPVSEQSAKTKVRKHYEPPRRSRPVNVPSRDETRSDITEVELRSIIAQLRSEVATKDREIERLQNEIARLRGDASAA